MFCTWFDRSRHTEIVDFRRFPTLVDPRGYQRCFICRMCRISGYKVYCVFPNHSVFLRSFTECYRRCSNIVELIGFRRQCSIFYVRMIWQCSSCHISRISDYVHDQQRLAKSSFHRTRPQTSSTLLDLSRELVEWPKMFDNVIFWRGPKFLKVTKDRKSNVWYCEWVIYSFTIRLGTVGVFKHP